MGLVQRRKFDLSGRARVRERLFAEVGEMSEHFNVLVQTHLYEKYILLKLRLVDGAKNIVAFITILR